MKFSELEEKLNKVPGIYVTIDLIDADNPKLGVYIDNSGTYVLDVSLKDTNWLEVITFGVGLLSKTQREQISSLVSEYLETPLDQRKEEKRYRLRWIDDTKSKNIIGSYVNNDDSISWYMDSMTQSDDCKNNALFKDVWSQSELEELKHKYPRWAPAIDCMKEPVEGTK